MQTRGNQEACARGVLIWTVTPATLSLMNVRREEAMEKRMAIIRKIMRTLNDASLTALRDDDAPDVFEIAPVAPASLVCFQS
jgi:hypothetical protein